MNNFIRALAEGLVCFACCASPYAMSFISYKIADKINERRERKLKRMRVNREIARRQAEVIAACRNDYYDSLISKVRKTEKKICHIKNGDKRVDSLPLTEQTITQCRCAGISTIEDVINAFANESIYMITPSARAEVNNMILKGGI